MTTQTIEPIDAKRAFELIDQAVNQPGYGPDYVYPGANEACVYVRDGKPSCLVGHALALAGIDLNKLHGSATNLVLFNPHLEDVLTQGALAVFQVAQAEQDCGSPWGVALDAARMQLNRLEANGE